jgi:UDP-4-amino-4,6-dideoxy-N-acetyl-beta-L-altrosamine transaminase/UDP-2,4-diacetamido-2,4,6-trideoxy-beta-L-altropyranose hydrolase
MTKNTIFFRVDSGNIIGTGHVQRCLNFADQFDSNLNEIFFICKKFDGNLISNIKKKYKVFELEVDDNILDINNLNSWLGENWKIDVDKTINILKLFKKINLLIVDHYGINIEWEKNVYKHVDILVAIDDLDKEHYVDIIQNQNKNKLLNNNNFSLNLLGNDYFIINKDIANITPKEIKSLKRINISLGGSDFTNETYKIIKVLYELNLNLVYDIIIGKANMNISNIQNFCKDKKNFNIYIDLDNKTFLNLMNEADLCIGGAGLTNFERCILNKPLLYLKIADNQDVIVQNLKKYNIGIFLGSININYFDKLKQEILKCINNKYLLSLSSNCNKFSSISNIFKFKNILLKYMENLYEIRKNLIPYGKQTIDDDDIEAVINVLKENNYLTTGPKVSEFENKVALKSNMKFGVACNNGTSALHLACYAIGITKNDEVIVPAISFVASANCVLYCEGTPVFCDIDEDTMNIDPEKIEKLITTKTKAIIAVDFAGQLCNYDKICEIAKKHNLYIIQDAAHSIGHSNYYGDIVTFSFHPVKHITTCEGGMCITNNENFYKKMSYFRTHGITRDFKQREISGEHYYEMIDLGFNYRIPDLLCALGISQLNKLDSFVKRRQEIAEKYEKSLSNISLKNKFNNVYHLYVIKLDEKFDRDIIFKMLKKRNIGVNVHYMPIYLHPYYESLGYTKGLCPIAEKVYKKIISLPIFPTMTDEDINYVIYQLQDILNNI